MKGFWYIPAFAGLIGILTIHFNSILLCSILLLWLYYLYITKRLGILPLIVSLASFSLFIFYIPQIHLPASTLEATEISVTGTVRSPVTTTPTAIQFDFQEKETKATIKVIQFNPDVTHPKIATIQYGSACQIKGVLQHPPGSRNPGQFHYQKFLAANGIHFQMTVTSIEDIQCQDKALLSMLHNTRQKLKDYISTHYSDHTSQWIHALVLGDDQSIAQETIELFQRWGLSHILAISGLHIGLIVGLFYFVTIRLNIITKEKAQNLLILFLPIYAVLAGGAPSVWRASLMVLIVILIQKIKLKLAILDVISITLLLLLMVDPWMIYHIGFQFSFLVTFGIILSRKWLTESDHLLLRMLRLSFISQLIIIPLQINYFYYVNPLSILLNVIVVPYFSFFVIPLMFIFVFISPISFMREILDWLFVQINEYLFLVLLHMIDQVAYYPLLTGNFPVVFIILYYGLFIMMMNQIQKKKLQRAFLYGSTLTLLLIFLVIRPYVSPYGTVTMLDIGQGDAFVIELPYRRGVILVDAGAKVNLDHEISRSNYTNIIKPFLQFKGIHEIDAIFISHEDVDHMGSVPYIVEEFQVKAIIVSEFFPIENYSDLSEIPIIRTKAGQRVMIKGEEFTILSPREDKKSSNENSLVFHVNLGNMDWLFTGDIDAKTEREVITRYPNLHVDVLKVAHHGSNTSSDISFISAIKPDYALISVGENNRYGHPAKDVISLLEKLNITILRTDQSGAIVYRFHSNFGTFYQTKP